MVAVARICDRRGLGAMKLSYCDTGKVVQAEMAKRDASRKGT